MSMDEVQKLIQAMGDKPLYALIVLFGLAGVTVFGWYLKSYLTEKAKQHAGSGASVPGPEAPASGTPAASAENSQFGSVPRIEFDEQFEPVDGPDSLRPIAIDIAQRVAHGALPYFEIHLAAIDSVRREISTLESKRPRSDLENRRLATLKIQLNQWVSRQEIFSDAITLLLTNDNIGSLKLNVPFDGAALSESILGLRNRLFTENVAGEHRWYLRNPAYASEVALSVTEADRRRMYHGKFLHDAKMRTLGQIEEEEAHFPLSWLDSDILFSRAVPAIVVSVVESPSGLSQSASEDGTLNFSKWQVHLRAQGENTGHR